MENDEPKNTNLIIANNHTSTVFNLEYIGQNLNDNIEYQKWKKLMKKEYGNNSKQFKCNKDKILFYSSYNDYIEDYYIYKSKCPVCNKYICYFCSYNGDKYFSCCIKNSILKTFLYCGPKNASEPFDYSNLFLLIPILNILTIILFFIGALYIRLILEKSKNNNKEELKQYVVTEEGTKKNLNLIIIFLIDILLSVPFIIIYNYFIILLIIISIPFKFVPLKYFLGAFYNEL
jgi:hypothetical protein